MVAVMALGLVLITGGASTPAVVTAVDTEQDEEPLPDPAGGTLAISAGLPDGLLESWRFFGFDPNQPFDPFAGLDKGSGR